MAGKSVLAVGKKLQYFSTWVSELLVSSHGRAFGFHQKNNLRQKPKCVLWPTLEVIEWQFQSFWSVIDQTWLNMREAWTPGDEKHWLILKAGYDNYLHVMCVSFVISWKNLYYIEVIDVWRVPKPMSQTIWCFILEKKKMSSDSTFYADKSTQVSFFF